MDTHWICECPCRTPSQRLRCQKFNVHSSAKTSRKKVSHVAAMKPEKEHKIECEDAISLKLGGTLVCSRWSPDTPTPSPKYPKLRSRHDVGQFQAELVCLLRLGVYDIWKWTTQHFNVERSQEKINDAERFGKEHNSAKTSRKKVSRVRIRELPQPRPHLLVW